MALLQSCGVLLDGTGAEEVAVGYQPIEASALPPGKCPYRPSFVQVRERTKTLSAAAALPILYRYAADPRSENPDACQAAALDAEIGTREMSLATIRLSDGRSIAAQASYRCDVVEPTTTACNGTVEDATARPFQTGVEPVELNRATGATVASTLPGAVLQSVHRLRVAQLLDGKGAVRLPIKGAIFMEASGDLMAITAIYTAPPPWKYRKFVWYYQ